jgi:hypothetical protein
MMPEIGHGFDQSLLVPTSVTLGTEEDSSLVVVDAVHGMTKTVKKGNDR